MKKIFSITIVFALLLAFMSGCTPKAESPAGTSAFFDFGQNDSGFVPIFADYPDQEDVDDFYEFQHSYGEVPIPKAGKGIFISGNNHSDDLFMGYVKKLEGFAAGESYHFGVSFKLATNVESGLLGAGGAPGESVTVKCGIVSIEPKATNESGYFRMNIDTGSQSNGGKDMTVVGNMSKMENNRPGEYEFNEFSAEFDMAENNTGEVYLIIGTDSGFEATTAYYLDDISVTWSKE